MTIISYANNHEDVVLARGFPADYQGFYVDVGAADPTSESVTKNFYDRGWRGINVEPAAAALAALVAARPRDINLGVGVSDTEGTATFHEYEGDVATRSTFVGGLAHEYDASGWGGVAREVELTTLNRIWEQHVGDTTVDFLKIDVEGHERAALAGLDLSRFRPRVVVVEATEPGASTPAHAPWEAMLTDARYACVLFDGLNRFYVRDEDPELARVLAVPANVFDDFRSVAAEDVRLALAESVQNAEAYAAGAQEEIGRATEYARSLEADRARLQAEVDRLDAELAQTRAEQIELADQLDRAERDGVVARRQVALLRDGQPDLERTRAELARVSNDLAAIQGSMLMRSTEGVRRVYYTGRDRFAPLRWLTSRFR